MTLLVNFVSMSVHLRSAKEGPSTMRRTCICRGNEQQSLLLPRVSCSCSSHAEDEYAEERAAKAGSCLVPALVSLSVQIFPTESFIVHTADLSAFAGCSALPLHLLNLIIGLCWLFPYPASFVKPHYPPLLAAPVSPLTC